MRAVFERIKQSKIFTENKKTLILINLLSRTSGHSSIIIDFPFLGSDLSPTAIRTDSDPQYTGCVRAAEYVRMSTDHQRYSTENQSDAIRAYAASHGMEIIRTYRDDGKSGLNIAGRHALRELIDDVQNGRAYFKVILVYDVSRWGRFQNADESAYYEYLCTRADIKVIYCAEPFDNDGSPLATIYKGIKRSMAGEYSRELSTKVFSGQCRLIRLGFRQGGPTGFGLRRALLNENNDFKGELTSGQHKSIQTDRVILVPGPQSEIDTVLGIYHNFIHDHMNERHIADALNLSGQVTDLKRPWTRGTVHQILINEKYIGNNLYNRTSSKLKSKTVINAPDLWIRCENAFQGLVSTTVFEQAQEIIALRSRRWDDAEMLTILRELFTRTGTLSGLMIDEQDDMPSSTIYSERFGGLIRAYALVGFTPDRDYRYLEINRSLRQWHPRVMADIIEQLHAVGASVEKNADNDLLTVNGEWSASITIARCQRTAAGNVRWKLRFDTSLSPDITLAVRMDHSNSQILDYYLFPKIDMGTWPQRLTEENKGLIDSYRFTTLDVLSGLAARISLKAA